MKFLFLTLLIILSIFYTKSHDIRNVKEEGNIFKREQIFITVSSMAGMLNGTAQDRQMELNWLNWNLWKEGDWVGLFNFNPVDESQLVSKEESLHWGPINDTNGYIKTTVKYERKNWDVHGPKCQGGFYIGYFDRTSTLLLSNCLAIYPKWMNDLKGVIGNQPLYSLFIPGTHDAGAIKFYETWQDVITLFAVCQEDTIYDQLVHGIRYLDIRVAYYPMTPEIWWVNHGEHRFDPLIGLFNSIKRFTNETNEIVFMDFHGFPVGFTSSFIHEMLIEFVNEHMSDYLITKEGGLEPTAYDFWLSGKNVILTYANSPMVEKYEFLWPYLVHAWGDKNKVDELHDYFDTTIPERSCKSKYFWSCMAEMTPKPIDYITYPTVGLRGFSQMTNLPVTNWFQRRYWYENTNIVSTDFYLGNNIIEMAIEINRQRANCYFTNNA